MGFFSKPEVIGPGGGASADGSRILELEQRVALLEAQLAQLAHQGAAGQAASSSLAAEPWMAEVKELRRSGKLIQAIKLYRERTGVGLKEAKDAVEALTG